MSTRSHTWSFCILFVFFLSACATPKSSPRIPNKPLSFQQAVKVSGHYLLNKIARERKIKRWFSPSKVWVEPLVGRDKTKSVTISPLLRELLQEVAETDYAKHIQILAHGSEEDNHYIIRGKISFKMRASAKNKQRQLQLTALDARTEKILASTTTWLEDKRTDYHHKTPLKLSLAVDLLSQKLIASLRQDRIFNPSALVTSIIFKPFSKGLSNAKPQLNNNLINALTRELNADPKAATWALIKARNRQFPAYRIEGKVAVATHPVDKKKYYQIRATVKDNQSDRLVTTAKLWIANPPSVDHTLNDLPFEQAIDKATEHLLSALRYDKPYQVVQLATLIRVLPFLITKSKKKAPFGEELFNLIKQSAKKYNRSVGMLLTDKKQGKHQYLITHKITQRLNPKTKKAAYQVVLSLQTKATEKQLASVSFGLNQEIIPYQNILRPFEQAVEASSHYLLKTIHQHARFHQVKRSIKLVVDSFFDAQSLDEVESSRLIKKRLIYIATTDYALEAHPLSAKTLPHSDYIVQGYLYLDTHPENKEKNYKIQSIVRYLHSGEVIARATAWIENKDIAYQRSPEYKDRPIFSSAPPTEYNKRFEQLVMQKKASTLHYELTTKSLLNDAGRAYAKHQYSKALGLYQHATQRKGDEIRTYAGLYLSNLRLGSITAAEAAFQNLLKWTLSTRDDLSLRMLFAVNSTQFYGDRFLTQQYMLWLKNIGHYFSTKQQCFSILGHSSRTGEKHYNSTLSKARAVRVKQLIQPYLTHNREGVKAVGKGFSNNISGLGTDDERDAIDRRVEFIKSRCKEP